MTNFNGKTVKSIEELYFESDNKVWDYPYAVLITFTDDTKLKISRTVDARVKMIK